MYHEIIVDVLHHQIMDAQIVEEIGFDKKRERNFIENFSSKTNIKEVFGSISSNSATSGSHRKDYLNIRIVDSWSDTISKENIVQNHRIPSFFEANLHSMVTVSSI